MSRIRCYCCGGEATSRRRHDLRMVSGCPNESWVNGTRFGGRHPDYVDLVGWMVYRVVAPYPEAEQPV